MVSNGEVGIGFQSNKGITGKSFSVIHSSGAYNIIDNVDKIAIILTAFTFCLSVKLSITFLKT